MQKWLDAVNAGAARKDLLKSVKSPKRLAYLLSDEETWARAYTQFIVEESGDVALKAEMVKKTEGYEQGVQWKDADFAPVRAAMREIFTSLGWMK